MEDGTEIKGAAQKGVHLRLPGFGDKGPTLEIYSYSQMDDALPSKANRKGFGHIASEVPDVESYAAVVCKAGGAMLGKLVTRIVPSAGEITFTYVTDTE